MGQRHHLAVSYTASTLLLFFLLFFNELLAGGLDRLILVVFFDNTSKNTALVDHFHFAVIHDFTLVFVLFFSWFVDLLDLVKETVCLDRLLLFNLLLSLDTDGQSDCAVNAFHALNLDTAVLSLH